METANFTTSVELEKPIREVFKHITYDVPKWWGGRDFMGNSVKLDDEFIIQHPGTHFSKQQLVEIIPDKKVVWLVTLSHLDWLKKDKAEWTDTKMIFELTANGDKTIVNFTHVGLTPDKECYERCSDGWNIVIKEWLFNYVTIGKPI